MMRALAGEALPVPPVWMMRQAGRYLPNYLEIRKKHSFWEMATTPRLISEVSLLPLEVIDVDTDAQVHGRSWGSGSRASMHLRQSRA